MYTRFIEELSFKFDKGIFLILCLFIVLLIISSLFTLKFFSNIEINENGIIIKKLFSRKIIKIENIKNIVLSETTELYGILADRTQIQLLNNEFINFYSFKYHDFFKAKIILNYINEVLKDENLKIKKLNLNAKLPKRKFHKNNLTREAKIFNFSNILSLSGIVFYSFILVISYNLFTKENIKVNDIEVAILAIVFFLFLHSFNTNYFIITKDYLIVKNSLCFWKNRHFEINEIESINIHCHHKQFGKTLLIKTKYFETISFVSDNLLQKQWIEFKKEIRIKNIIVFDNSSLTTRKVSY
jgi:hypothetical protein